MTALASCQQGSKSIPPKLAAGINVTTDVKTIAAKTLFERLAHLVPRFDPVMHKFCMDISERRNAELHSADLPFRGMRLEAWEARYWHACDAILRHMESSLEDWLGADAEAPRQIVAEAAAANRIMKAAVARLSRIARTTDNQRRLRELAFAYADIADVPVAALRWDEVTLDRTNARWRELLNLARLLLGNRFQTTSAGGSDGFSLLFEMNTLFEEYVARMLRRGLANTDLRVVSQGGRLYCLETNERRGLFQTRPDILIKRGDVVVQVIDTKWKRIAARIDDPKQGVSQADVYQMMAYGRLYRCGKLTLLYPHHREAGCNEGLIGDYAINASEDRLELFAIDVARGEDMSARLAGVCLSATPPLPA